MARFVKGRSGNPAGGRPPSPETLARRAIGPHLGSLVEKCVAAGLSGDSTAAAAAVTLYSSLRKPKRPAA